MFSFFSKKSKKQQPPELDKHDVAAAAAAAPEAAAPAKGEDKGEGVLSPHDEKFFKNLADNETREIPLDQAEDKASTSAGEAPSRDHGASTSAGPTTATDGKEKKRSSRWPSFFSKKKGKAVDDGGNDTATNDGEANQDWELQDAMKKLNLFSKGGKTFSPSSDTKELLDQFTQILKDVVNGVPTAYGDLVKLFDSSSQIEKKYDTLPSFLKKLITTLPTKLFPGGPAGSTSAAFALPSLQEMVANPETITSVLKTVMNALEARFPAAALGTNALVSLALFVLLFILWCCYKRGRDVRLEKEAAEVKLVDASSSANPPQAIEPAPSGAATPSATAQKASK
ncbi:hypothetical protein BOTBODRAFT_149445 [Botryobasidium botryosum FD-172 SS1]|uniref:Uncharacterized protein n=1 Tax=Botryobasidium botryosum (strain FD-172 SS1) TaxID=930990 RepID=A0A067M5R9_BOTB1|nr:hypothetical protein BOTBODRAFT_149445 [Botryobasidium botryosum FD-172 SS1]